MAVALRELERCVALSVDGVLVADMGLLYEAGKRCRAGELGSLKVKTSAAIAPRNSHAAALYEELGASSINVAGSASLQELTEMRRRLRAETVLDVYVESPEEFGGGLRYDEISELARALQPVNLKLGLRNAPTLYPYGQHLEPAASATVRERIRRGALILERLLQESTEPSIEAAVS
jgi:hypothetical protein